MSTPLRRALAEQAIPLSQRVLDRMYENPFWMERYGERGRRFANEDSLHHVSYLDQALAAGDPAIFERYAQWLRTVLVTRGMCSEHLAENFRLLAAAIADAALPDAADAREVLMRGDAALRYVDGRAGVLERARQSLLDAVAAAEPAGPPLRDDDRRYLVSYLIDAAATGNGAFFDTFAARFPRVITSALIETATTLGGPATGPAPPPAADR
jgi:hypothetical protein